jgi:hypothetical protein
MPVLSYLQWLAIILVWATALGAIGWIFLRLGNQPRGTLTRAEKRAWRRIVDGLGEEAIPPEYEQDQL